MSGGRQRVGTLVRREEWTSFEKALLVELDTDSSAMRVVLEHESPAGRCPAVDPSHIFKTCCWDGDRLLLCTQTEVLVYDPKKVSIERTISHPCFNDVHHVARLNGRIHVASTGLDAVFVLGEHDEIVETHGAVPLAPWGLREQGTDYRTQATTKPHHAHPNYVFSADGSRWMTRFEQHDAIRLDGEGPAIKVADAPIHDGVPHAGAVWFTVVSGQVVRADPRTGAVLDRWDLNEWRSDKEIPLGWCRGIAFDGDRALVGFSRLRPTKFVQNLAWLRPALKRPEPRPCRLTEYDLGGGRELRPWNLESVGMSAVFGVVPYADS